MQISQHEYDEFRGFLEDASGIVLGDNKQYLVTSRLNRLVQEFQVSSFSDLMRRLHGQPGSQLRQRIIDAMTTNETQWFRDTYPFEILSQTILPELASRRPGQLRIWSAASSSGQEAYSISILLEEFLHKRPGSLPANIQIIGTDISRSMLEQARSARYDQMALGRGLSQERLARFFTQKDRLWELKPTIKNRVSFRELNLLQNFATLGKFDIIFCRNVLIYFSSDVKKDILERMAQSLTPGGYLILGGSESPTTYSDKFELVRTPQGVVYRLKSS